jgi:hypothetical protein
VAASDVVASLLADEQTVARVSLLLKRVVAVGDGGEDPYGTRDALGKCVSLCLCLFHFSPLFFTYFLSFIAHV